MSARPLPVRPEPRPGEPLTSYAVRLADANGIHRSRVLPRYRHDIDIPATELGTVASLAGLDPAATSRLTMNRYPLIVRGHGPQRRHGWRLHHSVTWICPSCTPTTGRRDLLWQTALMPVCLRCGCYLVRAGTSDAVRPASARVLELAGTLAELADDAIDNPVRPERALPVASPLPSPSRDHHRRHLSSWRHPSADRCPSSPQLGRLPQPRPHHRRCPAASHRPANTLAHHAPRGPPPPGQASSPAPTTSGSSGCSPASATTCTTTGCDPNTCRACCPHRWTRRPRTGCVAVADPSGNRAVPAHRPCQRQPCRTRGGDGRSRRDRHPNLRAHRRCPHRSRSA
jgi:hypothetical protein